MAEDNHVVGAPFNALHTRIIMPIVDGTVKGPRISATIERNSGADWGTTIQGAHVSLHVTYADRLLTSEHSS